MKGIVSWNEYFACMGFQLKNGHFGRFFGNILQNIRLQATKRNVYKDDNP
jgi:hypothetical protein